MKFLIALAFAGVLLAGCSDSSTEPTATSDAGSADTSNTDTGGSTDTGGTDTGGSTNEPEPSTIKFTGDDFGYPLVFTGWRAESDPEYDPVNNPHSVDERVSYTVWAVTYVQAHSLLEAMHAINGYREDFQQIKIVNGGTQDLNSLINDYCPTSGASFAANRCEFYARLAYTKTMAQDGWQLEHRENNSVPMVCYSNSSKFSGCSYNLMGHQYYSGTGDNDYPDTANISTSAGSPIEGWQYEKNQPKISSINGAVQSYVLCAMEVSDIWTSVYFHQLRPALSPWPFATNADQIEATQYGVLTVWLINEDTVEDVYTDVTAEHDGSNLCKAKFQLDLKDVQPNASF